MCEVTELLTSSMESLIPLWQRAPSCCLQHTQGRTFTRESQQLPWMLQDGSILPGFYFLPSSPFAFFFVCGRQGWKMPSAFSHPALLSRGRWWQGQQGGDKAGVPWGQSPSWAVSQSDHQSFGDRATLREGRSHLGEIGPNPACRNNAFLYPWKTVMNFLIWCSNDSQDEHVSLISK